MNATTMLLSQLRAGLPWARARFENSSMARVIRSATDAVSAALDPCRLPAPVPVPVPVRRPQIAGRMALLAAVAATLVAGSASAYTSRYYDDTADGRLVDVQVLVGGQTVPLYGSPKGDDRMYFEALKGRNYSVVLRNRTGERVGVLLTVDGLNVIDGNLSNRTNHEPMYVLDAYESATIQGWRTSLSDIRKFVFVDEQRSYAERTGQGNGDLGWIRVTSYREQRPIAWWPTREKVAPQPYRNEDQGRDELRKDAPESAPEMEATPAPEGAMEMRRGQAQESKSNPGTGWGEHGYDPVRQVDFRAAAQPTDRMVLRYEYASGLRALGIQPYRWNDRTRDRDRGQYGFAQPPRW
jgi:hypothetical protein